MRVDNEMELKFKSLSQNESFARSCVAAFCSQLNPTIDELNDIRTAVSEAVTNCVVHAYPYSAGDVYIKVQLCGKLINIEVKDHGVGIADTEKARQPFYTSKPDEERSGMGFTVMESFMDKVEVTSDKKNGVCVSLVKSVCQNEVLDKVEDWGRRGEC